MILFLRIGLLLLFILIAVAVKADPIFTLGQPLLSASGCPVGSVSVTVSPDGTVVSLIFDNFILDVQRGDHSLVEVTRSCKLRIPIQLPAGNANFFISQNIEQNYQNNCKGIPFFEFNSTLQLQGPISRSPNRLLNEASLAFDSIDVSQDPAAIRVGVRVRKCQ